MQKNDATGWYANVSKDKNGQPEALNLGVVTIRPASARFVEHRLIERSHNAFDLAKKAGRLHGPLKSQVEAEKLLGISAPPPPPPAEDPPPADDVLMTSGEGAPVTDSPSSNKPKKLRR